jgi:hypothetical protein
MGRPAIFCAPGRARVKNVLTMQSRPAILQAFIFETGELWQANLLK